MLLDWWNYNLPDKSLFDYMEQDALWHMLESSAKYAFQFNNETVITLLEPQFFTFPHFGLSVSPFAL